MTILLYTMAATPEPKKTTADSRKIVPKQKQR